MLPRLPILQQREAPPGTRGWWPHPQACPGPGSREAAHPRGLAPASSPLVAAGLGQEAPGSPGPHRRHQHEALGLPEPGRAVCHRGAGGGSLTRCHPRGPEGLAGSAGRSEQAEAEGGQRGSKHPSQGAWGRGTLCSWLASGALLAGTKGHRKGPTAPSAESRPAIRWGVRPEASRLRAMLSGGGDRGSRQGWGEPPAAAAAECHPSLSRGTGQATTAGQGAFSQG